MVTRWTIGCVLVCTACAAAPAPETVRARAVEVDGFQAGEVVVGDQPVFRILADDGELTALDRATIIAGRLQGYLSGDGIVAEPITFRMQDGERALMYGEDVPGTVDRRRDARPLGAPAGPRLRHGRVVAPFAAVLSGHHEQARLWHSPVAARRR